MVIFSVNNYVLFDGLVINLRITKQGVECEVQMQISDLEQNLLFPIDNGSIEGEVVAGL